MDWMNLLYDIFDLCIIPLFGVLVAYVVKYINAKGNEIAANVDSELASKYIVMLTTTIADCVIATNQTYVEALKKEGKFDKDAQAKAFQMTYDAVMDILTDDAKEYLANFYGDLTLYLTKRIEAEVVANKK
jgi:hypothetical protein